jgi:uncharacterized protein (TIGR02246 family)
MKKIVLMAVIATSLFACQTATKPAIDLTKAKSEIEAVNKIICESIAKGDSVSVAEAYAKDGKLMGNNMPAISGKDNLTSFWGAFINSGVGSISLNTLEVWGDENYVTEEGVYDIKLKDGNQIDKGKYLVVWKHEDGKWKIYRDLSNTDMPLTTK